MDDRLYWLWLAGVLGFASPQAGTLLDLYGDAENLWQARDSEDFSTLLGAKQRRRMETLAPEQFAPQLEACDKLGVTVLPYGDARYPLALLNLPDPPVVLYCTGDADALTRRARVGMVGSRRPSPYGAEAARTLADGLARAEVIVVSGLADGLDSEAHKAALAAGGATVGVLGTAIDQTYPAVNRRLRAEMERQGAVVSEYPPGTASYRDYFLQRNRLIAALSDLLCVVEARQRSGTMSTVHHAQRYGRPVYAVPGSIFSPMSEGTNALIAQGQAAPALSADGLLKALGLPTRSEPENAPAGAAAPAPLLAEDAALLEYIGARPVAFERLCAESGLGVGELLAGLTRLELAGQITALAGRRYQRR